MVPVYDTGGINTGAHVSAFLAVHVCSISPGVIPQYITNTPSILQPFSSGQGVQQVHEAEIIDYSSLLLKAHL